MPERPSERRLVENEKALRTHNAYSKQAIKKLVSSDKAAYDFPIEFACECSDRSCTVKVAVSINRYEQIHARRDRFIVAAGHEVPKIEKTVEQDDIIAVVEKRSLNP